MTNETLSKLIRLIFVILIFAGAPWCQEVVIVSAAASKARTQWVEVAVPAAAVPDDALVGELAPHGWEVVAGRRVGLHSRMLAIRCVDVEPGEPYRGSVAWEEHTDAEIREWHLSTWAGDEPEKLVPSLFVMAEIGGEAVGLVSQEAVPETVYSGPALRVLRYQARLAPQGGGDPTALFFRCYYYLFADQDVIPFDAQVVHSDSSSPLERIQVRRVTLRTGEYHTIDLARHWGIPPAQLTAQGSWASNLLRNVELVDGVRPAFTGKLYCLPGKRLAQALLQQPRRFDSLIAATEGDLVGCAERGTWDGSWLALGKVPEIPTSVRDSFAAATSSWRAWLSRMAQRGDYWEQRRRGLSKRAGSTGSQEDFGATKGGLVVSTGNPLPIQEYSASVSSQLRATAYYEHDLELVTKVAHPDWVTWSQHTHRQGSDFLGKGKPIDPTSYGWTGVDDQHFSFLNEQAALALTGRYWLQDLLRERVEVWLAAYHDGAGRAIGRTFQALSNDYLLSGDERIRQHLVETFDAKVWGFQNHTSGPIKYYEVTKDPRALVDENGDPVAGVNIWQHGLMAPGLVAALNVTGDPRLGQAALWAGETVSRLGYFQTPTGFWQVADYVKVNDGHVPPAKWYGDDGNVPGFTHTTGWFHEWTAPALWALLQLEPHEDLRQRTETILASKGRAKDWSSAEWRAMGVQ